MVTEPLSYANFYQIEFSGGEKRPFLGKKLHLQLAPGVMPSPATDQIYYTRTRRGAARCCVDLLSDYMHTTTERIRRTALARKKCRKHG